MMFLTRCFRIRRSMILVALAAQAATAPAAADRWEPARAHQWMARRSFVVGCNYIPASAVNQLEMWQAETFDPATIDRELGWASAIGFNAVRVFLHDLAWAADPAGFLERLDRFLAIADRHKIAVLVVFFDGVWDPEPRAGAQPPPRPGVHNSRWVQSPGRAILADPSAHAELEKYVKAVLARFRDDRRVLGWDLFNEPDHDNRNSYVAIETRDKAALSLRLLKKVFQWAREVNPSQPLTVAVWQEIGRAHV